MDIGANNGISSAYFHNLRPQWKIIAFEPNILHQKFLARLKKNFRNFDYHLIGLSNRNETVIFYTPTYCGVSLHSETSSSMKPMTHFRSHYFGFVVNRIKFQEKEVPVKTLDEMSLQPDVIKIDSEGNDLKILKGAKETIKRCRPFILFENQEDEYLNFVNFFNELNMKIFLYDYERNILIQSKQSSTIDKNNQRNLIVIPEENLKDINLEISVVN